jgi:hypothetical protein
MSDIIAGVAIPDTLAVREATRLAEQTMAPAFVHHSRRVFLLGSLLARRRGLDPHPELLYLAAMFHDSGLLQPAGDEVQRFELDGADHARRFLLEHGFTPDDADVVWVAVALHTTPGIPDRMAPVIAATHLGVLSDAVGFGFEELTPGERRDITAAHPRDDFARRFLETLRQDLEARPGTAYGTVNADVLERFVPELPRENMVDRVLNSPWTA